MIGFENFTLSANIASSCGNPTSTLSSYQCGVQYGQMTLFLNGMNVCTTPITDGMYGFCYHNPSDEQSLFNS